jgi:minor histocompatibility antigen H13
MLTVATSDVMNAPTRLLFPRIPGSVTDAADFPFSLLGLGDVAVPGLLACLALRYDASRVIDMRPRAVASLAAIDKALGSLPADTNRGEMGDAAVDAAFLAYDNIADTDDARRNATTSDDDMEGEAMQRGPVSDAVLLQRRYFMPVMMAYVVGLIVAFVVNSVSGSGQPALLYLCPATLGGLLMTAVSRREVWRLWSFVDLPSSMPTLSGKENKNDA